MKELRSEIRIGASTDRVWAVLTDFAAYPAWNPFILRIEGEPRVGARWRITIRPPGARAMTFRPTVLIADPPSELRWLGRLGIPGIFDGEHSLHIVPLEDGAVLFVQRERFTGWLVPLAGGALEKTLAGFEAMNRALKERAEARPR